jgi:predicted amidohydrolase YtcJ
MWGATGTLSKVATLYRNGRVITSGRRGATAFVVDGGHIGWLGDEREVPSTAVAEVVDLAGAFVTPAFVDAHVHATSTGLALTGLDLRSAGSLAEALTLVERAARAGRGRPLLGGGWDETGWPERRPPTSAELDRAGYGGLVYLARVDVHSALASSALLASVPEVRGLAGFDRSGWVRGPAHDAVRTAAFSAITGGQRRDAQRAALRHAAGLGIACVHEMAGPIISSADDLRALLELAGSEPLPEVVGYWAELFGIETARELGAVGAAGDLFCDGSLGSHTAALNEPYTDRPGTTGLVRFATEDVAEHIVRCTEAGLQAGFHAIGDAAVDQVLDAVELASSRLGRPVGSGHRIEHAEFVTDPGRLARSGLIASVQPCFDALWGGPDAMYAERLGPHRAARLNRFAELADAGVPLAFGSDSPVTELGPWAAVRAAVHPTNADAAISAQAAFEAHTAGGHRAAGRAELGELVAGAPATFAVWQTAHAQLFEVLSPGAELPTCLATLLNGRPVFDAGLLS